MADLLNRFGPVVDISGLDVEQMTKALSRPTLPTGWRPTSTPAWSATPGWRRPGSAVPQGGDGGGAHRQGPAAAGPGRAGLPMPACRRSVRDQAETELRLDRGRGGLAGDPQAAVGPGQPVHVPGPRRAELARLLDALGSGRPEMVLEGYLADDPARADERLRGLRLGGERRGRR